MSIRIIFKNSLKIFAASILLGGFEAGPFVPDVTLIK